jgi:ribosomal peptide maturation radical SAM protein 1
VSETALTAVDVHPTDIGALQRACGQGPVAGLSLQTADSAVPGEAIRNFRVALVTMPFACSFRPSIQLGLLKAIGRRAGFPVDDYYLNLDLSAQLGFRLCDEVQNDHSSGFTGEWLFTVAAFGEESNSADYFAAFPEEVMRLDLFAGKDIAYLKELRADFMPGFIEDCMRRIDWGYYRAVGFTSTFQQNVASLALARRIKEEHPHVSTIFGGSNMDGEMGIEFARAFPYVDFVVNGEGDAVFPELLTRLAEGRNTDDLLGVAARRPDGVSYAGPAELVQDLDSLPSPDYDTYYDAADRYEIDKDPEVQELRERTFALRTMPVQGSRGCWWGQKSHCTFCGFNRSSMAYRSKSPERLLAEIDELSKKYDKKRFWACDNILNMKYIEGLFGPLAARDAGYEFFFFSKANLTRDQLRLLARGGMRLMFPGIESFNTHLLKLMRKGATRLQNVNVLRWSTYYGIELGYFLLHGFPGEQAEDYVEERETLRLIHHLNPPMGLYRLRLDRFSPNFADTELFPTHWRRPVPAYEFIYPPYVNLQEAAYFFEYDSAADVVPKETHQETKNFIRLWGDDWLDKRRVSLTYRRTGSDILIQDTRFGPDEHRSYTLFGSDADIYEAFSEAPRTPAQAHAILASECPDLELDEEIFAAACDAFCDHGLMIGEAGKYLSLAIPADPEF